MENTVDSRRRVRSLLLVFSVAAAFLMLLWGAVQTAFISPLSTAGYKDFSYDDPELPIAEKLDRATAEKPESKLWWNDGYWWGVLYNRDTNYYHIYRLNWGDNEWVDTGVQVDDRRADPFALPPKPAENVHVDVLWDQATQKLYVASHIAKDNGGITSEGRNRGLLFRYSYDKEAQTYLLDTAAGFLPGGVQMNKHKSSTLVLAKDSTGRLWSSFVARKQGETQYKSLVSYSSTGETVWERDGFAPPFTQTVVSGKDISTIFAFNNKGVPSIGVLWTNEVSSTIHLAIHPDAASPTTGWTYESVPDPFGIDNHIAVRSNAAGQIFIAVKMKPTGANDPQVAVIARDKDISSTWTIAGYSTMTHDDTRPTLLIDEGDPLDNTDDQLYVFATGREGGSDVCYKTSSIDQTQLLSDVLSFKTGDCGTPILMDNILDRIDDASTTKQNVNENMGLAVIGSDTVNGMFYVHNTIGDPIPVAFPFGPPRNAVDVLPTTPISATFNKPMKDTTITGSSFYVENSGGQKIAGTVIYDSGTRTAFFYPTQPLQANATYTAKLTRDVRDAGNVRLNEGLEIATVREQWSFTAMSPTVQFEGISYSALENGGQATVTVTLSSQSATPVSVQYATADMTASGGADYTAVPSTTLTFNPAETVKTFTVNMLDDVLAEGNEGIKLALSHPISASLGLNRIATLSIFDNEAPPTVQFETINFNAVEDSGQAQVRVSLFPTTTVSVNVDIATLDGMGDATAVLDYTPIPAQTISFAPGESEKIVNLLVVADALDEVDEQVYLNLGNVSDPTGTVTPTLGALSEATVTINDDDDTPVVAFSAPSYDVVESDGVAAVEVTLSAPSGQVVTVNYETAESAARAPFDYEHITGTLTFQPGETSHTFNVVVVDDSGDESDEDFEVALKSPVNAMMGIQSAAAVVIEDNDNPPTVGFELGTYTVDEDAGTAEIIVALSGESGKTVTVDYATSDGTATDGDDYDAASGTITFNAGVLTQTLSINILDNAQGELVETFDVTLSNPGPSDSDLTLGAQASTVVEIDDDDGVQVSFETTTMSVAENGVSATVQVRLSSPAASTVTIDYLMESGTAVAGADFTTSSGKLTFAPGQTIQTIQVPIINDGRDEETETFVVKLGNPTNAFLGADDTLTVSITDDDDGKVMVFLPVMMKKR